MLGRKAFNGTDYCGLCRLRFPVRSEDNAPAWQYDFRAAIRLDEKDDSSVRITSSARLPNINSTVSVIMYGGLRAQIVTIRRSRSPYVEHPASGEAFCFHDWCYSILVWTLGGCPNLNIYNIIYKLARTLLPGASRWETVPESRRQPDSANSSQMLVVLENSLQKPLISSTLPPEIRSLIWGYVGSMTPYSIFVTIAAETSRLAHHFRSFSSCNLSLERGSFLSCKTISVFGTEYIQDLVKSEDHQGNLEILGDVTRVKFIANFGGICAIKLIGDDWETDWVGKDPRIGQIWYGTMEELVSSLHCSYNDLNCIDVSNSEPCSTTHNVWDHPSFEYPLAERDLAVPNYEFSRNYVPMRQFFRYVPLYNNGEYIKGLTIYLTACGIVGFETQFTYTSQLSGCRDGCAVYFPLWPHEQIAYAWLRVIDSPSIAFGGPALIIQTTFGRMKRFGSFILPRLVEENVYHWIFLGNKGPISAFYYENPSSRPVIVRIGTICDGVSPMTTSLTPYYHVCAFPVFPVPLSGLFLSVAVLSDLRKVDLCRVGDRCTGILMLYTSGFTLVLGQWHVSSISQHSCIYDSPTEYTANICFTLTALERHKTVTNVTFSEDSGETEVPDSVCEVFSPGMNISWWFSEFYDAILPWTGVVYEIPEQSKRSVE